VTIATASVVMFKDTEGNTVGAMQYLPGIR
jgi:hypothetical protein